MHSLDDWDFSEDDLYIPYPSNTPVNEAVHSVMELWGRQQPRPGTDVLKAKHALGGLTEVRIISQKFKSPASPYLVV